MRRILPIIILLAWGLWLGGMIALFIAISSLFSALAARHDLAGLGASRIFRNFNFYQLAVAAITLLAVAFHSTSSRNKVALVGLLAVAMGAALVISLRLTPLIERMRLASMTHSPQFSKLHGISMAMYAMEALLVFIAGFLLPGVLEKKTVE
jgi:hypothetical protein